MEFPRCIHCTYIVLWLRLAVSLSMDTGWPLHNSKLTKNKNISNSDALKDSKSANVEVICIGSRHFCSQLVLKLCEASCVENHVLDLFVCGLTPWFLYTIYYLQLSALCSDFAPCPRILIYKTNERTPVVSNCKGINYEKIKSTLYRRVRRCSWGTSAAYTTTLHSYGSLITKDDK